MLPLSMLWAMEPTAFLAMSQQIRLAHAAGVIQAGPADDAERAGLPIRVVDGAAVIAMRGPMVKRESWMTRYFGMSSTTAARVALAAAVADPKVETIVLAMDTPGGTVDGLAELADAVLAARQVKTVIAQVDGMTCSAGYYVASQASRIVAGRADLIGSIGVRMMLYDFSQAFEQDGIEAIPIDTGPFKSAGAMGTKITDEQRADFQRVVDAFFADFLGAIERGRPGLSGKRLQEVADGRVFTASEALNLGLIDGIQPIDTTLSALSAESAAARQRRLTTARARTALRSQCLDVR